MLLLFEESKSYMLLLAELHLVAKNIGQMNRRTKYSLGEWTGLYCSWNAEMQYEWIGLYIQIRVESNMIHT